MTVGPLGPVNQPDGIEDYPEGQNLANLWDQMANYFEVQIPNTLSGVNAILSGAL